ncbi:hypothetical protein T4B_366 [Trichinella pseudospiralis]|uniref:Uncharacterized protein n=1 Tax=Trichinella pseudospiralis TaxID=6337 RepID=A0A0V1III8_TRIPS|nr:hypothetical protein T4B_366 [Trichinella pseudospiralis]
MKTGKSENVDGTWSNTYTPLKMDNFAYKSNDVRVYQLCKSASSQNEQQIIVVYKYTEMISMNLMELVSNSVRRLNDEIMLLFSGMKTRKVKIWTTRSTTKERSSFFDLWVDDVHVSGSRREKAEALRKTLLFAFLRCYIFKNPKICVLDERTRVKVQMACGHDVIERWMFSSPIFHETTSVEFGVSEFTVAATVWRYFSENKDRKNYYFYRSCTNDYIPGCTQLDDVEN